PLHALSLSLLPSLTRLAAPFILVALHAYSRRRSCHRSRLSSRRHRTWHLLPPRPAKCSRLFSRGALGALVGYRVFHRGHGDFDADDHWDARDCIWQQSHFSPTCFWIPDWAHFNRVGSFARIFSRRVFHGVCAD